MAATSIRWALTRHMVTRLRTLPGMSGVEVWPAWPGDTIADAANELVWCDNIDGPIDVPMSKGPNQRVSRDDKFELVFLLRVKGAMLDDPTESLLAVGDRMAELVAVLEGWLADDPSIDEFDGVVSAEPSDAAMTVGMTAEAPMAYGTATVAVHSRLN